MMRSTIQLLGFDDKTIDAVGAFNDFYLDALAFHSSSDTARRSATASSVCSPCL